MKTKTILHIRGDLLRKGYTMRSLAREIGVSPTMVRSVLHDKSQSARVEMAISKILGYNPFPKRARSSGGVEGFSIP